METQREPKSWAMLAIFGPKLRPVDISEKLSIDPDYFHDSDTKDIQNNPLTPHWQINSKLSPESSLNDHLWEILKRLAPVRRELKDVASLHEACFYASVEFSSPETKGIRLEKRVMLLLGELGINLEILPWQAEDYGTFS
ncbi:DUF4279 domain-containing protein [Leptospira idonii]|uniref:DUF4279 domain-containing protein n=1 Tax=Leptospira idonii TaxID=1193500 RepID=A0A4R9M0D8_9LEPT|nr:DUF4279 domain-containing protein [Leptospira idonii]TGN19117.1 DUF4279 domain-containing protein [Leptospira idonii]